MIEVTFGKKKIQQTIKEYLENISNNVKASAIVLTSNQRKIYMENNLNLIQNFNMLLIKKYGKLE